MADRAFNLLVETISGDAFARIYFKGHPTTTSLAVNVPILISGHAQLSRHRRLAAQRPPDRRTYQIAHRPDGGAMDRRVC